MMSFLIRSVAAFSLLLAAATAHAQTEEFNAILFRLFGNHDNFSVDAQFQRLDSTPNPAINQFFSVVVAGGRMRIDFDLSTITGTMINPTNKAQLKASGWSRVTKVLRQDKNRAYVVYPDLRAYADVPLPVLMNATNNGIVLKKTPQARETIDSHPCVKNRIVIGDGKRQQEFTVWEATDLKDFPIQIKLVEDGQNVLIRYRSIRFVKVDATYFDPPAGFSRFESVDALTARMVGH
jgi:hypothetical protein